MNYMEDRLKTINLLLQSGISTISPREAERLKKERDEILKYLNIPPFSDI